MELLKRLSQNGIIDEVDIEKIRKRAAQKQGGVEAVLTDEWGIDEDTVLKQKAAGAQIESRRVDTDRISRKVLDLIPEESATHYKFVPIGIDGNTLEVGVVDPDNIQARDALNFISAKIGMPFEVYLITQSDFEKVLQKYQSLSGEVTEALSELETELEEQRVSGEDEGEDKEERAPEKTIERDADATRIIEDAPVTKIVATILRYATEGRASDIHIEPMRENIRVRFRVDGVLGTSLVLPLKVHSAVVARIKILSSMRLDEKRKPQDGRFSATIEGRQIDFRVSTFPTYYGEKIVMRLLDQEKGVKKITELGLSERNLDLIRWGITQPHGLVLISGPTGSGKTTTLYAMLQEVDKEKRNVLSLEDPVEYNIPGLNQSQVRPDIGYTFANGLRTTLRQDPDIIMVGEIRDKETAQLAIQAALTGHLVLSTIHTNSAVGVVPRLVDMGVDPYLIAPTLVLAIAQRLVHTLCEGAGTPKPIEGAIQQMIEKEFEDVPAEHLQGIEWMDNVYEASSTSECPTGVRGRTAVMEVVKMEDELERVILEEPTEYKIAQVARKQGMLTMKQDAIIKAMHQEVPFEEVNTLG